MERGNFSAAAGFGMRARAAGHLRHVLGVPGDVISEITMARLNYANVLAHFSHGGVDDMADNTCHFGINNLFADGGLARRRHTRACTSRATSTSCGRS